MRARAGLLLAMLAGAALAAPPAPAGRLAYLRGGWAWVQSRPGAAPVRVPNSRGAALLDLSPVDGALTFLTGPAGAGVPGQEAPPLKPYLSRPPYTASLPWGGPLRARWLAWAGDGRHVLVGTDRGTLTSDVQIRRGFVPDPSPPFASTSRDGEVTAVRGSVASPEDVGVLLYGPGARPGTEVFTRRLPQNLMRALKASPQPALRKFLSDLDPRAQADDANWTVTAPQVTADGRHVYFASNVGSGVGSAGTTTSVVFEVDVAAVTVRALGWLGPLAGSVLEVRPSPDGERLLVLVSRHTSNAGVTTLAYSADLRAKTAREVLNSSASRGTLAVLDSACWLADSRHLALSAAYPRPDELNEKNGFEPPTAAYTLFVKDAATGAAVGRVPGARGVACGPR